MKTLVVAPTASNKAYAFAQWAAATSDYDRLVAIDSTDADYGRTVSEYGVPYVIYERVECDRRPGRQAIYGPLFNAAWRALLDHSEGYTHLLALDTDVIPDGDILAIMEENYDGGFLRHGVPWRDSYGRPNLLGYEMSCTFASKEDWEAALKRASSLGPLTTLYEIVGNDNEVSAHDIDMLCLAHLDDGVDSRRSST